MTYVVQICICFRTQLALYAERHIFTFLSFQPSVYHLPFFKRDTASCLLFTIVLSSLTLFSFLSLLLPPPSSLHLSLSFAYSPHYHLYSSSLSLSLSLFLFISLSVFPPYVSLLSQQPFFCFARPPPQRSQQQLARTTSTFMK